MQVVQIPGNSGSSVTVRLRPLTGEDEFAVTVSDPSSALRLLSNLLVGVKGRPVDLNDLTVSQIDRLLAALYNSLYGDAAECQVDCPNCGERFEFTLWLSQVMAAQDSDRPGPPDASGVWTLPDERRVRAPRLSDFAEGQDPSTLYQRLVVAGDPESDPEGVSEFLERAAPVLSLDLHSDCPECGAGELVRFDLARYLARRLSGERPFLIRETHLIAARYGWSHSEIMSLSRTDRRAYAGLIETERSNAQYERRVG